MELMGFFVIRAICGHSGVAAWAGSPREQKAGAEPGETPWAWVTPGNHKAPFGSRGCSLRAAGDRLCCPPGAWSPCQQLQERLILSWSGCCCSPAQLLPLALHPEHCTAAPAASHPPARGLGAARASPGQEGMWKHHSGGRELWVCAVSSAPSPVPQFPPL